MPGDLDISHHLTVAEEEMSAAETQFYAAVENALSLAAADVRIFKNQLFSSMINPVEAELADNRDPGAITFLKDISKLFEDYNRGIQRAGYLFGQGMGEKFAAMHYGIIFKDLYLYYTPKFDTMATKSYARVLSGQLGIVPAVILAWGVVKAVVMSKVIDEFIKQALMIPQIQEFVAGIWNGVKGLYSGLWYAFTSTDRNRRDNLEKRKDVLNVAAEFSMSAFNKISDSITTLQDKLLKRVNRYQQEITAVIDAAERETRIAAQPGVAVTLLPFGKSVSYQGASQWRQAVVESLGEFTAIHFATRYITRSLPYGK